MSGLRVARLGFRITVMISSHAQRIAGNVRAELARRNLTQDDVAKSLKLSRMAVYRRITGSVDFRITELYTIAEMLGIHVNDLIGEPVAAA